MKGCDLIYMDNRPTLHMCGVTYFLLFCFSNVAIMFCALTYSIYENHMMYSSAEGIYSSLGGTSNQLIDIHLLTFLNVFL